MEVFPDELGTEWRLGRDRHYGRFVYRHFPERDADEEVTAVGFYERAVVFFEDGSLLLRVVQLFAELLLLELGHGACGFVLVTGGAFAFVGGAFAELGQLILQRVDLCVEGGAAGGNGSLFKVQGSMIFFQQNNIIRP
jgi:hypothetical protein